MGAHQASAALPATLRGLRLGVDDEARIRRTVHLAAAKIEDLQTQVSDLMAKLQHAGARQSGDGSKAG